MSKQKLQISRILQEKKLTYQKGVIFWPTLDRLTAGRCRVSKAAFIAELSIAPKTRDRHTGYINSPLIGGT